MRTILERLLSPEQPVRIFGRITGLLNDGRYIVTDDQGRKITVGGAPGYLPGLAVIVSGGQITGPGRRAPVSKTYRV